MPNNNGEKQVKNNINSNNNNGGNRLQPERKENTVAKQQRPAGNAKAPQQQQPRTPVTNPVAGNGNVPDAQGNGKKSGGGHFQGGKRRPGKGGGRPDQQGQERNRNDKAQQPGNQQRNKRPAQGGPAPRHKHEPEDAVKLSVPLLDDDFIYFPDDKKKKPESDYVVTEEAINAILDGKPEVEDDRPRTEVIGIRFKKVGKMYYFSPNGVTAKVGNSAIVETARGTEFGQVCMANKMVLSENIVQPLRPVLRLATPEDIAHNEENAAKEKEAFRVCLEKIVAHELDMKLVDAQYTFDNQKLIFYFTSAGRVDFRDLVKDLASVFRIRIELRQIGIRDEAKLMGGLGVCGRPLCCASYLTDFVQVSIKMAKEQNLSLNSSKISGACGRLMCCLRYEYDTYQKEIAATPPVDSVVETPDGRGTVTEINPLAGTVKVRVADKQDTTVVKQYKRELCRLISSKKSEEQADKSK